MKVAGVSVNTGRRIQKVELDNIRPVHNHCPNELPHLQGKPGTRVSRQTCLRLMTLSCSTINVLHKEPLRRGTSKPAHAQCRAAPGTLGSTIMSGTGVSPRWHARDRDGFVKVPEQMLGATAHDIWPQGNEQHPLLTHRTRELTGTLDLQKLRSRIALLQNSAQSGLTVAVKELIPYNKRRER
jgi:hypothetical protein